MLYKKTHVLYILHIRLFQTALLLDQYEITENCQLVLICLPTFYSVRTEALYVLIRCAQTNVNYFLLKCYRNNNNKRMMLDAQAIQPNVRHHKENKKVIPRKN